MRVRVVSAVVVMVAILGCASGGSAPTSRRSGSLDVITQADIEARAADATTALQIIEKLRPQMLRSRGVASPNDMGSTQPRVYVDNISFGEVGSLANVNASQIREIRYINARDATTQWGTGHMGGVILVSTKR